MAHSASAITKSIASGGASVKLDEEKSKYAGLAQEKWFWVSIIQCLR
jgi:hypothetical protein